MSLASIDSHGNKFMHKLAAGAVEKAEQEGTGESDNEDVRKRERKKLNTMNHASYRRLSGASGHSTRSDGRLTGPGSIVDVNPVEADMAQPETLRQKAFAKLKLFNMNFSLNMNQCRWVEFCTVKSR